jgi:dipeptidyl aminopeptidase/acylaminoacyl peptidase
MEVRVYLYITVLTLVILQVSAQSRLDGEILSSKPWPALPAFESLDDFSRKYFPKAVYDEARTQNDFDILDITYASDGIPVRGTLVRPKNPGDRKWPAILFARGGTGDYGRITLTSDDASSCTQERTPCLTVVDLYLLAKAGFVVIASDYRFHGATAKRDEWGGVDVNDLLNLVPALRSIDFVDLTWLYMLGVSRGGTMTYLALKRGAPVRAVAVIAGPSDLEGFGRFRPEFVNGDETYDGWAKVWPDYASRATEYYRERSAVQWADKLTVPILILHSRQDRLVPVDQAIRMAAALQAAGRTYALHVYANDGHSLPANRTDRNRQIVEWFMQAK